MEFVFIVDKLGIVFAVLFATVFTLVGIAALEYMEHEGGIKSFYGFYIPTAIVLVLACFAGNFFTYYVLFELMTFISMPMVLHSRTHESVMAALKYLFYSVAGAFLTIFGFFLFLSEGFDLSFLPGGSLGNIALSNRELFGVFLMIIGFGTKAGMFPMHGWLPTAHPVAPAPASAVLSGVITKAGVLGIIRCIYYVVGVNNIRGSWVQYAWIVLTLITIFMGSMMAYMEKGLKKRMAYSTVSQVSYILFGLSLMEPIAFVGAIMHVVFHSIVKDTLFLTAGSIIMKTGKTMVKELDGIGKSMPVTMWCFTLVSVTLIGIPPTSAFVSKWYLGVGAFSSGIPLIRWLGPCILLISALLTAGYLLTVSLKAFFGEEVKNENEKAHMAADPGKRMLIPIIILTIMAVLFGIIPKGLIDILTAISETIF
ncbi:MAG: proton-conducting membrane transporter [Butyrivibrio sp.]|nr:proton-conducting membrane transporter [Butyrivibrio sp.]